ncbi:D-2-hydroxyacid dehydrogenase [Bacillus songklensis]|uniref:D-2-hydroxyacid dehydrogenase n=1 Tax=Bacillus songklensis TaxID=1069116 RepID=A0ABV8B3X9_9BACI
MNIENILVTGRIYKGIEKILEARHLSKNLRFLEEDEVSRDDFLWADAYVSFRPTANFEFGNLKWVHSLGAGVDAYLFQRKWDDHVLLTRSVCSFGSQIGEYCLSYILRDLQCHETFQKMQSQKRWEMVEPVSLQTQTVVVYGTGEIGQELAKAFSLLGMMVYGVSLSGASKSYFRQVVTVSEASDLLMQADWVVSTLPLTSETYQLFCSSFFAKLNSAGFINVGRGATVDEPALLEALENGRVRRAVLDVVNKEPLPDESPLWEHPNLTITPHIAAITSPGEAVKCFMETLNKIEKNEPLLNQVDIKKGY